MKQVAPAEIRVAADYDQVRDAERRAQADLKANRRILMNDTVAVVFENHDTVRGVVEEVVRTEHLRDIAAINAEVEHFNALVPAEGELSACLYLEVTDAADLPAQAARLAGVERAVFLEVGGERIAAQIEELDLELGAPAMYHLRFRLGDAARAAWRRGDSVSVGCDHPGCSAVVVLDDAQRQAIGSDLTG